MLLGSSAILKWPNMISRTGKSQYTENEAAEELGVSVERLRGLIKQHIVISEEDANNIPIASFQPSDLLLLRFLTGASADLPVEHPSRA